MFRHRFIFSVDDGQYLWCGRHPEFPYDKTAESLVNLLAVPVKPNPVQLPYTTKRSDNSSQSKPSPIKIELKPPCQTQSYLTAIADELILMIFRNLDLLSCFRLSLVSQRLWRIGWILFQQRATKLMGPWAGKRIINSNHEWKPDDLPAGFLTTERENIVDEGLDDSEIDPDDGFYLRPGHLLNTAMGQFQGVNPKVEPYEILCRPLPEDADLSFCSKHSQSWHYPRTALDEASHLPETLRNQVRLFATGMKKSDYYPQTESWLLRNLTTAEIVQGDELFAAFPRSKCQDGPHLGYPGFAQAILSRIYCYRGDPQYPFVNCGVWAGHRLEICTRKVHASSSNISWKDVTGEVIDDLLVAMGRPTRNKSKKTGEQEQ